jgi:hypothetical protein
MEDHGGETGQVAPGGTAGLRKSQSPVLWIEGEPDQIDRQRFAKLKSF